MLYLLLAISVAYWLLPRQTMLKHPHHYWAELSPFRVESRKTWLSLGGLILSGVAFVAPAILVAIGCLRLGLVLTPALACTFVSCFLVLSFLCFAKIGRTSRA